MAHCDFLIRVPRRHVLVAVFLASSAVPGGAQAQRSVQGPLPVVQDTTVSSGASSVRVELGPVFSANRIHLEGDAIDRLMAAGAFVRIRGSKWYGLELEVTHLSGQIEQSYEGTFVAYPPPGVTSSSPDFARYAPIARRTRTFVPGLGGAVAFVAQGELGPRVDVGVRAGVAFRSVAATSRMAILSVPEGIDPARVARDLSGLEYSRDETRGGLLLGVDLPIRVISRLRIVPTAHVVVGPEQVGNVYRESGGGLRICWMF